MFLWWSCAPLMALPPHAAYVANSGDGTVSVLSLESRQALATIDVGDTPESVTASPDGLRVYVANRGSNNISVIDTVLGAVAGTPISVGTAPTRLALSRDGERLYVANSGSASISVIDTSTNLVVNTVATVLPSAPMASMPTALAFNPNRDELWIGFAGLPDVLQVRQANNDSLLPVIDLETTTSRLYASYDLEFRPDGSEVFGVEECGECGRFHRFDGDTPITLLQQDISMGGGVAIGLAMNPVNDTVYLAKHNTPPRVIEFGGAGRTLTFPTAVQDVMADPDGSQLLVSQSGPPGRVPGFVSFVDAATFTVIDTVEVGIHPARMAAAFREGHTWNVDADGNWSSADNWAGGEPNGVGVDAAFAGIITAPRTVTVDGPKTAGTLTFNNSQSYTLAGAGPLTLSNGGAAWIDVATGSHTISAPFNIASGKTVIRSGAGELTISGMQNHGANATLIANGGITNLNSDAGANLALQANAGVNLGSTQHLASLQIGAGATVQLTSGTSKTLVTPTLTISGAPTAPTAKLDLNTNSAVIDYIGTSPAATIRELIIAGRDGPGAGQTWNGMGIASSAAAAAEARTRSVGYAENSALPLGPYTNFRGQPVDDTSLLIGYTRTGDANLDGVVNDADVTIVSATYAPGVPQPHWALGDFDYNGFVDDADVTLLGVFYDPSAPPLIATVGGVSGVAAVPEPGTWALAACALFAGGLLSRRRREILRRPSGR